MVASQLQVARDAMWRASFDYAETLADNGYKPDEIRAFLNEISSNISVMFSTPVKPRVRPAKTVSQPDPIILATFSGEDVFKANSVINSLAHARGAVGYDHNSVEFGSHSIVITVDGEANPDTGSDDDYHDLHIVLIQKPR